MIDLQLLGTTAIRDGTRPDLPRVLVQPKRLALFTYLTLAAPRGFHRRDTLLALFWPERTDAEARAALSDAVYFLRRWLGSKVIINRGKEEIAISRNQVRCDALEFERALEEERFATAVDLYTGDLLAGFHLSGVEEFERWLEAERARLRAGYGRALEALAELQERQGERDAALASWRRLCALDPYDSRQAVRLIEALERAGSPAAALREAEAHAALLHTELGMGPPEALARITDRLRTVPPPPALADPVRSSEAGKAEKNGRVVRRWRIGRPALLFSAGLVSVAFLVLSLAGGNSSGEHPSVATADPAQPSAEVGSIAVLPFANLSPDPRNDYFSDGITEEITNALTTIPGLRVVARTSAFAWKGMDVEVTEIGRRLDVTHLLQGSVRRDGQDLRIAVQLVEARSGLQLWSRSFDRRLENVFEIQEEVSRAILGELYIERTASDAAHLGTRRAADLRAYDLYLIGWQLADTGREPELRRAIQAFREALELDPFLARALAAMALTYIRLGIAYLPPEDAFPHARTAAERALEVDSSLAAAHDALAFLHTEYYWQWEEAERRFRLALSLAPGSAGSHGRYQNLLRILNRCEEAVAHGRRTVDLDPLAAIVIADLGLTYYYCRRFDEAVEAYERSLRLDGARPATHLRLAKAYEQLGRYEDALLHARQAVEIAERLPITLATLGRIAASAGRKREATAIARALEERARAGAHVDGVYMSALYTGLDDTAAAMDWLERAYEQRSSSLVSLAVHPWHDPLRARPEFRDLLRRMALE
jgi:TolB-like protein/DNA-binding SARP family transcriptional activator